MHRLEPYFTDIQQATMFDIQNVADYFWHHTEEYWDLQGMTLAPVFDYFATRYTLPERVFSREHGWTDLPADSRGAECLTVFRVTNALPPARREHNLMLSDGSVRTDKPWLVDGAKWHYDIFSTITPRGASIAPPPMHWFMALDERGVVCSLADGTRAFWAVQQPPEIEADITILPVSFLHVSGLALTFLHTKNVEVITPDKITRRRVPRERKYENRFHRLRVNAIGGQKRSAGAGPGRTGIRQSLAIVRGHFREYGPEFGRGLLFGKHAGRFWIAAHFKGDPALGRVDKDYEVK